jgi:hypothetical protein
MENSNNLYKYEDLPSTDSLRILSLKAGQREESLIVSLEVVPGPAVEEHLANVEALSYVWGNPTRISNVTCNQKTLRITSSLEIALRAIRHPDTDTLLWADAICINQDNPRERNHQIKLMTRIYSKAKRVLVWLGPDPKSRRAGRRAFRFAQRLQADHDFASLVRQSPLKYRAELSLLKELASREWFHRMWYGGLFATLCGYHANSLLRTMQEIGLATEVVFLCGSSRTHWNVLYFAYAFCHSQVPRRDLHTLEFEPSQVVSLYNWMSTAEERTFLQLLVSSETRNTTDPRDRVFALLSHPAAGRYHPITSQPIMLIEPDYTKTFQRIYAEIAHNLIRDSNCLDVLSYVRGSEQDNGLPTWAPLWSQPREAHSLLDSHLKFSASGPIKSSSRFWDQHTSLLSHQDMLHDKSKEHRRTLSVLSVAIEKVADFTTPVESDANALVMHCLLFLKGVGRIQQHKHLPNEVFEVLTCGHFHPQYAHENGEAQYAEDVGGYRQYVRWLETDKIGDWGNPAHVRSFDKAAWYACSGRSLFHTREGHLGLGPAGMRVGDEACLLRGAKVPFIVRKLRKRFWSIVGECYMPGFMDGEALPSLHTAIKPKMLV